MAISGFPQINTGGGTGGTDLSSRYGGEWDLNAGGSITLVEAFPDPTKSTGFIKVNNDVFNYLGDSSPISLGGGAFADFIAAEGVSPVNSGVRSFKIAMPSFNNNNEAVMCGIVNNANSPLDLLNVLFSQPSTASGFFILGIPAQNDYTKAQIVTYPINNGVLSPSVLTGALTAIKVSDITAGEPVYFDLDTATGVLTIAITGSTDRLAIGSPFSDTYTSIVGNSYNIPASLNLANFTNDTFAPFFGTYSESTTLTPSFLASLSFDLGTTESSRQPFLSALQVIQPPVGAADGKVYKVFNNGTYLNNPPLFTNDYVEFYDNLTKLIITRPTETVVQTNNRILSSIEQQTQTGGLIDDAIINKTTVLTEDLTILSNTNYDIDPDVDVVVLKSSGGTTNSIVNLPDINYQYHGKRLLILSDMHSVGLSINAFNGYLGLPQITSVTGGDSFEFAAVRDGIDSHWVRVT